MASIRSSARCAAVKDYMTNRASALHLQNEADLRGKNSYAREAPLFRFVTTRRDLAIYVPHDTPYQSYLNACLIMLAYGRAVR